MAGLIATENLAQAIPMIDSEPMSANQIRLYSQKPRMRLREAEAFLSFLVEAGEVRCIEKGIGRYRYYIRTGKCRGG